MSNLSQQQIEDLIQFINNTEEPGSVTNLVVGAVLGYLLAKAPEPHSHSTTDITGLEATIAAAFSVYFSNGELKTSALPTDFLTQLSNMFDGYATIGQSKLLNLLHSRIMLLDSMGQQLDGTPYTYEDGDLVWSPGEKQTKTWNGSSFEGGETYLPRKGVVFINKHTGKCYMWDGSSMVEIGSEGNDIYGSIWIHKMDQTDVANIPNGQIHFMPSTAKLVYRISSEETISWTPKKHLIYVGIPSNTLYRWTGFVFEAASSSVQVVNSLASNETNKALSAKMGHDLLVLIQQIYNSLGNAAFWGAKPEIDWSSAGLTTHNITRSLGGHASSSSSATSVAEGARLTETITFDAGWMKSSLTVEMNNVPVPQYIDNNTNTIDIPSVTGPVVITATAVQGTTVALTLNGGLHCADSNGNTIPNPTAATSGEPLSFEVWPDKWWQVPVLAAANDAKMTGGSLLLESITRQVTGQSTWDASGVETQNQTVTAYGLRVTAKNGSSNEVTGAITLKLTAKDVIQVGEFFAGSSSGNDGSLQYNNPALCRTNCYIPLINANTVWWRWGSSAGANRFATAFYPATGHDTQGNNGWCNDQGSEKYYPNSGDMSERPYARCTFVVDEIASGYFEQVTSGTARQRLFTPAPYYYAKLANS